MQQARLFTEHAADDPGAVSPTKKEIRFDGRSVLFFGHSQGGVNGPLFLAADDPARGGVLSGTGRHHHHRPAREDGAGAERGRRR